MEHRHEFTVLFDERGDKLFAFCGYCEKTIDCEEVERRLNATEFLSAEDAETSAEIINVYSERPERYRIALSDYAKTLRGE